MTEVEKLYENAGINKTICKYAKYGYEGEEGTWYLCTKNSSNGINLEDRECWTYPTGNADCVEKEYPPFTAEKQLELIKWLAIRFNSDYMSYWHNEIKDEWIFGLNDLTELSNEEPYIYEGRNKDFTEALCNLINNLWQDLTEQEQQQIKEILK